MSIEPDEDEERSMRRRTSSHGSQGAGMGSRRARPRTASYGSLMKQTLNKQNTLNSQDTRDRLHVQQEKRRADE